MPFPYTVWMDLGTTMAQGRYQGRFFDPQVYQSDNPLENLVVLPSITDFFATKVCNIFIVGHPYGWTKGSGTWAEAWPPDGYADAKTRHINTFALYTKYETHVYMDYNIVNIIMGQNPDSNFRTMMDKTKTHMQEMCSDLSQYGFMMEADITSQVGQDFFQPVIDKFYGMSNP